MQWEEMLMDKNDQNRENGVPLYLPAMLFGMIPILIAGQFIPRGCMPMKMPQDNAQTLPGFMPGGGGFPFPESEE